MKKFEEWISVFDLRFSTALTIAFLGFVGWVLNISKIVGSDFTHVNGLLVARIIGAFVAPIGAVLGFF